MLHDDKGQPPTTGRQLQSGLHDRRMDGECSQEAGQMGHRIAAMATRSGKTSGGQPQCIGCRIRDASWRYCLNREFSCRTPDLPLYQY